jgi:hypothetical protein
MKIEKKDIVFWFLIGVIVIALVIILTGKRSKNITDFSLSPTPTAALTTTPKTGLMNTPAVKITASPKPGLIAQEVRDYDYWFRQLDSKNMVLGIYDECSYIVPSNLVQKNNVTMMLDNTRSSKAHVLKIGNKDYPLAAKDWELVVLSSSTLPSNLVIFCENRELGQIELQ